MTRDPPRPSGYFSVREAAEDGLEPAAPQADLRPPRPAVPTRCPCPPPGASIKFLSRDELGGGT